MPRKKSVQLPPLDSFETVVGGGIVQEILLVELRDETCPELGSGKYQSDKFEDRRDTILMELLDYDPAVQMDALKSAASFFKWREFNTKTHHPTVILKSHRIVYVRHLGIHTLKRLLSVNGIKT